MGLFTEVFNRASIYDMLFFNVKSVLQYPTLQALQDYDEPMYDRWNYLAETKYNATNVEDYNRLYLKYAIEYPEFSKIIAITYANLHSEGGTIKREFKKIANEDEGIVVATFMDEMLYISSEGTKSTPNYFPILCGHNIVGHDIPLLLKRHIYLNANNNSDDVRIPLILKRALDTKPWESGIIDTINVWKFGGYDQSTLMLISKFLGLKQTVDLLPLNELSKYYWTNVDEHPKETLEYVALQSATQTNLVIQLMNNLRKF